MRPVIFCSQIQIELLVNISFFLETLETKSKSLYKMAFIFVEDNYRKLRVGVYVDYGLVAGFDVVEGVYTV